MSTITIKWGGALRRYRCRETARVVARRAYRAKRGDGRSREQARDFAAHFVLMAECEVTS